MYKLAVITAVNPHQIGGFDLTQSPLVTPNKLIVFCAPQNETYLRDFRQNFDPELKNTHFIHYDDHNTDAWHLYSSRLAEKFTENRNEIYNALVDLNRFAFIRDYFSKNFFQVSHVMWMDWNSPYNSLLKNTGLRNLSVCQEAQTLFAKEGGLEPSMFIVPQEMAWNFYYLNKLEHRETINGGVLLSQSEYFSILLGKYSSQIVLVGGDTENIVNILQEEKEPCPPEPINTDSSLVVVVNHYQHDTSWINRLNYPAVVYNKNPSDFDKYTKNLPNVGFDSIVYFTYIIENYDNLPDYVCFLQDDPFFHCMDVIQIVNNFAFDREFVPMGTSYYLGAHDWVMSETYAERVALPFARPLKMITSCQSIISKNKILTRSKEFYQLLISTIDKTVKCPENYAIENLWPTIFSFNEELVPCLNCKGHGDKQ
jgi:hypothetical protein